MNKKVNKAFIIPLILGIASIVSGIVLLVTRDPFDQKTFFLPPILIFIGFVFAGFVTTIVFAVTNAKRNINQQEVIEEQGTIFDELHNFAKKVRKIGEKKCEYCESAIKADETSCPNCGAKLIN